MIAIKINKLSRISDFVRRSTMHQTLRIVAALAVSLFLFGEVSAQNSRHLPAEPQTDVQAVERANPQPSTPIVTATASSRAVRYVSVGEVRQTRLQVFSADGVQVFDSDFKLGNLVAWHLQDQQGQPVATGTYLFLVSVKDFNDNLTQKFGTATLEQEQVYLEQGGRDALSQAQSSALEVNRETKAITPVDRVGVAALNSATSVASVNSKPEVSATTAQPTSKSAATQQSSAPTTDALSGTGTQYNLAKWMDNVGTLGNSNIYEDLSGKVGIGTTTPQTALEVKSSVVGPSGFFVGNYNNNPVAFSEFGLYNDLGIGSRAQFYMRSSTYTGADGASSFNIYTNTVAPINIGTNGVPRLRIEAGGNVGIGTTTPSTNLEVRANSPNSGGFFVGNVNNNPFAFSEFGLYNDLGPAGRAQFYMRSSTYNGPDGASSFNIYTNTASPINLGTAGTLRMKIDGSGRVGIGTNSPTAKLDVAGDMNVTGNAVVAGNIAAKYQDVAEWVPSREQLKAGTVVVLDTEQTNAVISSHRAYDTHVAGVVSAQPGVILGQGGDGKVLVATTGRVKVKVDATRSPIRVGDLLVTSNREGVAMRSLPVRAGRTWMHRPGTIIGKALEPLAVGTGEILVLLSLQ